MERIYTDQDVNTAQLKRETIAIVGYDSQGRAHARNLRDSGFDVVVGARRGGAAERKAKNDGFRTASPAEAAREASLVALLTPDMSHRSVYLSALQSALLNEAATLFRRRYYLNGSHAGFILYATGEFDEGDVDSMREALKNSKGPGNFRNLFVHAPSGKEGGIKLLPIAEVGAKDEFLGIKNTTRDDVLAAHRVPPQLLGIIPANAGGFGNVTDATDTFFELEIDPIQATFAEVNDWLGLPAITFKPRASAAA
jgi:hypothetical protein